MQNGAKTGVHVLLIVDTSKKIPYDFSLDELEQLAEVLHLGDKMVLKNYQATTILRPDTGELPIAEIIEHVNKNFARLDTVKVPFEKHLPKPS